MKKTIAILSLVLAQVVLSDNASAQLIQRNYRYIHHVTGMQIELDNINEQNGTATYFDYKDSKRVAVKLSEVSRETDEVINGVRAGRFVLVNFDGKEIKTCETYYLFENGTARIGCQSGKIRKNIGVDRPKVAQYNVNAHAVMAEVDNFEGYARKEKVTLNTDAGKLKAGSTVRIEALFPNGEALIQKMGANLLDTSGLLLKQNIERVSLRDLDKK